MFKTIFMGIILIMIIIIACLFGVFGLLISKYDRSWQWWVLFILVLIIFSPLFKFIYEVITDWPIK